MADHADSGVDRVLGGALSAERVTLNEVTARRINEAIEDGRITHDGRAGFICECGQLGCSAVIELTLQEYEAVRADGRRFAIAAGHEADIDAVVSAGDRYAVVEKQDEAGRVARRSDPRSGG